MLSTIQHQLGFSSSDNRISLTQRLNVAILNALWHISTGEKLKYDDPHLKVVVDRITSFMTATSVGGPLLAMPWFEH
jgi:hypothetical protein